jgi:hypothetical protein
MKKADNFDSNKWLVENKITTQSRLNENFEETHEYLEISPENFHPGDYFLRTPVYDNSGEFFDHKEKIKILSIDLPKDGRSDISKVKTEDGEIMGLSSTSLYDIARPL